MLTNEIVSARWSRSMAKYNARPGNKRVAFTIKQATRRFLEKYHPEELPAKPLRKSYKKQLVELIKAYDSDNVVRLDMIIRESRHIINGG